MDDAVAYVGSLVASGAVPGACLVVSRNGAVDEHYWGVEPETPHMLLSFTKVISVTALSEANAFGWDDLVASYIPAYATGGKERTTIRHLLTHSAGVALQGLTTPLDGPDDWTRAIDSICAASVECEPGTQTLYHAVSGVLVAAEIARRVTGAPFGELVRRHVVEPLGLSATFVPSEDLVVTHPQGVRGARWQPAGGMFGTARDVIAVLDHHLEHGDRYPQMHRLQFPELDPWAIGWLMRGEGELRPISRWFGLTDECSPGAFSHAGGATILGLADPASRTSIAFLTTAKPGDNDVQATKARTTVTRLVLAA